MQTLIVMLIVLAAVLFVGSRWRRTLMSARVPSGRTSSGCGTDCGCGK
jgi:hypothetical protein